MLNNAVRICKLVKDVLNLQRHYFLFNKFPLFAMKNYKILIFIAFGVLLLSGCRSSKGGGKGAYDRNAGSLTNYAVDYSNEETDAMGRDLALEARRWLGTPYRYGGTDRNGTDCSGLVMELYRTVCAMKIPRTTVQQNSYCTKVARNKARAGDLVFFGSVKGGGSVSHVGLYIGEGEMIHASSSRGVMISRIDAGYWGDRFCSVGRVDGAYSSWAKTDRGAKASKKKGSKGTERNHDPYSPSLPSPMSPVPVPIGEIAYDAMPLGNTQPIMDAGVHASGEGVAASGELTVMVAPVGIDKEERPLPTPSPSITVSADPVASIDLLDLIINQKVDSIFSDRFMD